MSLNKRTSRFVIFGMLVALLSGVLTFLGITSASAHDNTVTGDSVCNAQTGKFDITWTVKNDHPDTEDVTSPLGNLVIGPNGSDVLHQNGVNAGNYGLTVNGIWRADNFQKSSSGSVTAGGVCSPPDVPVVAAAPDKTPATCFVAGTLVIPNTDHVSYTGGNNGDGPGTYNITAVPDAGYVITGTKNWSVTVDNKITGNACKTPAIIVAPKFIDPTCEKPLGSYSVPKVAGIFWQRAEPAEDAFPKIILEAFAKDGYKLVGKTKWVHTFSAAPTNCNKSVDNPKPPTTTLPDTGGVSITLLVIAVLLVLAGATAYVFPARFAELRNKFRR